MSDREEARQQVCFADQLFTSPVLPTVVTHYLPEGPAWQLYLPKRSSEQKDHQDKRLMWSMISVGWSSSTKQIEYVLVSDQSYDQWSLIIHAMFWRHSKLDNRNIDWSCICVFACQTPETIVFEKCCTALWNCMDALCIMHCFCTIQCN